MYLLPATDKTMSDQVYILISDLPIYEPLVQWYDHRRWLGRPRFDSWEGQFFEISYFDSYDIFHMFRGIYRHIWTENITTTVVWWLCCQSVELIVTSSTPESEVSGGRGDAQEPVGGWMTVHLKSQGTPRQDSVVFSGLRRLVICLREKKNFWYSTAAARISESCGSFCFIIL